MHAPSARSTLATSPWLGPAAKVLGAIAALAAFALVGHRVAHGVVARIDTFDGGAAALAVLPPPVPLSPAPPPVIHAADLPLLDAGAPAPGAAEVRATPEDPVYLNQASAEQLRRLPGVGPKRADAIVALRARLGKFQRVEDLLRVKGIGRAAIRRWRPLVRLDAPPAAPLPEAGAAGAGG